MDNNGNNQFWYKEGLKFECHRCGNCCGGEPGVVWVNEMEIHKISNFMGLTPETFVKNYLRYIDGRLSLLEYMNGNCIMYDNGCKIYPVRPSQCRSFPFWKTNLENRDKWNELMNTCSGINRGKLHTDKDIRKNMELYERRFG